MGACDDTVVHACYVANSIAVAVCVYGLLLIVVGYIFWRFRWWPMSRLRARQERKAAEIDAYIGRNRAEEAGEVPRPTEDEVWQSFGPDGGG